jgi:hypothetical protein
MLVRKLSRMVLFGCMELSKKHYNQQTWGNENIVLACCLRRPDVGEMRSGTAARFERCSKSCHDTFYSLPMYPRTDVPCVVSMTYTYAYSK